MYEVNFSERVLEATRELLARNPSRGLQLAMALQRFEYQVSVYPQFGQPLYDLSVNSWQLWVGVISPLVFHYILDEERRRVMIVRPPVPLPHTGIV